MILIPFDGFKVQAACIYPRELQKWRNEATFQDGCTISGSQKPHFWYCQPKYIPSESQHLLEFLDPEHLLTNMRTKICSTGMQKANISRKAWIQTAKNGKSNGSNLNLALVEDLVDKQNVGFAIKTFSLEVENAMREIGFENEANFCSLMRNWYRAQDERGLSSLVRHEYEQNLRTWLLNNVRFDVFPPPGKHVKDIPVVLFEGLLVHIDRRSQLYAFTGRSYNARSLGTLDNENLFGAFQDWDAKGSGVLRADEVKHALYTACDLYATRLNTDRGFYMHTSSSRVYPVRSLGKCENLINTTVKIPKIDHLRSLKIIEMNDHIFDLQEEKKMKPKRKKGTISSMDEPARGTRGIRAERYRIDETKIFPHTRAGIELPDIIYIVQIK